MKKLFLFALLLIVFQSCSKSGNNVTPKPDPTPVAPKEFTSVDANTAIDAFNDVYFDTATKLYRRINNGSGDIAAIWTQPIYWDMLMNAYKRTKDPKYAQLMEDFYQGGEAKYDNFNWANHRVWFIYDDMMWWVVSFARAYEITKDQKYLDHAVSGFKYIFDASYDPSDHGMFWDFNQDIANTQNILVNNGGKTACINYPTVIAAMTLYNITKDVTYLSKAKDVYAYSRSTFFDPSDGKVADGKYKTEPVNWTMHVYNQATCIGAAMMLYKETKDQAFLNDAILAADYTKNKMSNADGMIKFETGVEQGIYTAIFAQYIIRLIEDGGQTQYTDWLRYNINTAWQNRNTKNLTYKDIHVTGLSFIESYDASPCPALMQVCPPK